jgi:uncharacterized membrane protein YhaH (DUF805 family)
MYWMLLPLRRYAEFHGRSRRMEYWMFVLFRLIVFVALIALAALTWGGGDNAQPLAMVFVWGLMLFFLLTVIPELALLVRRFHDQGKSGWLVLLGFIPLGGLIILVFMCIEGQRGSNEYGEDPKIGPMA